MITERQAAAFWRLFGAAARNQSVPDREAYRKRLLREELGVEHMSEIGRTRDYDRIMHRLALEAEDWTAAAHYAVADARRMAAMVADSATQVLELSCVALGLGASANLDPLGYVSGVLRQSGMSPVRVEGSDYWLDLSPDDLMRLFQILDTHRRRLVRRLWTAREIPLAYARGRRWQVSPDGVLSCTDPPAPSSAFRVKILAA